MYITGLEASGLYGFSFEHQLQRCVLFTGKNFVGKSLRQVAIRFALQGCVPDLDKTNQALWELSAGSEVQARVQFDDGQRIATSLHREGESIKKEVACSPGLKADSFAKMPMLDPEQYFGLTDSERIQYVFGMMKMPDTFTVEGILADLRNISLEENTEQTEAAKNDIIGLVKFKLDEGVGEPSLSIASALTDLTREKGTLKTEFSIWNRRAKDTVGTLRVLSELKTREGECSADTIQGVATELKRVAAELATANQVAGSLSQRQMEANRVALRRRQIEEELARVPTDFESPQPREAKIVELDAKLKKTKAPLSKNAVDQLEADWDNLVNSEHSAGIDEKHLAEEVERVNQAVEALKGQVSCPHCKSKGKDWKKNLGADYANQLAELVPKLATIVEQRTSLKAKVAKAKTAWDRAKTSYDARQQLLTERQEAERALGAIKARQAGAQARRQGLQEEASRLEDVIPPTDTELTEAAETVARLNTAHQALTERHTTLVRLQQDLIRAGEAAEEHRLAAAKVAVIKAVGAKLKEKQAEMIDVVFRDLMKVANYFTRDIMEHELVFQEGRIGYVKHGHFVSHKTFSGTEKALTYIAITAALMKDAPLRIVLLDEFDIDADVFPRVLNRLACAVRDNVVDQVIVAHTEKPPNNLFEWQHIPLQKAA